MNKIQTHTLVIGKQSHVVYKKIHHLRH